MDIDGLYSLVTDSSLPKVLNEGQSYNQIAQTYVNSTF